MTQVQFLICQRLEQIEELKRTLGRIVDIGYIQTFNELLARMTPNFHASFRSNSTD